MSELPELKPPREPRYKALGGTSLICVVTGLAYLPTSAPPRDGGAAVASGVIPLSLLAAIWVFAGLAGMLTVAARRRGHAVFALQFALFMLWSLAFLVAWPLGSSRGWVVSGWMGGMAIVVAYATRVEPPLWSNPSWWSRDRMSRWLRWNR
jgi:hypothetical protein